MFNRLQAIYKLIGNIILIMETSHKLNKSSTLYVSLQTAWTSFNSQLHSGMQINISR